MAVLSDPDRIAIWGAFMRDAANLPPGLSKVDLRAAFNAADDWADTNAAAFNTALPVAARTALSSRQKAALLMFVIQQRFVVS